MEDNAGGTPNPLNPNPTVGQNPEPINETVDKPDTSTTSMGNAGKMNNNTMGSMPRGTNIDGMSRAPRGTTMDGMNRMPRRTTMDGMSSAPRTNNRMNSMGGTPHSFDTFSTNSVNDAANTSNSMGVVTNLDGSFDQSAMTPASRPMEQAPSAEPPKPRKRKKTGLIVGLIISLFVAVGCGVAAILLFVSGGTEDAVAAAMSKLVSGKMPENVIIDGTIDFSINDASSPFSSAKIDLNTEAIAKSLINSTKANLSANLKNGGSFSVEFDEVYAANGDLYLKIDGISNVLNDSNITNVQTESEDTVTVESTAETEQAYTEVDCYIAEGCPNDGSGLESLASLTATLKMLELIDGEWIRISTSDISSLVPSTDTNELECFTNSIKETLTSNNALVGMYNKNPFVTSTSENLNVTSEKNPIYLVTIDNENLRAFLNQFQKSTVVENYNSCTGQINAKIDIDAVIDSVNQLPEFYVEIDGDHNFTRIYFETDFDDGKIGAKANLNLTYPTNVNVPAPVEYKDLSSMIQEMMTDSAEVKTDTTE